MGAALAYYREGKQQSNEGNHSILNPDVIWRIREIGCRSHGPIGPKIWYSGCGSTNHICLEPQARNRRAAAARSEEDKAAADAEGYGFGAGGGAEFAEDGGYVEFGGVVGDVEAGGDFFVGQAGG
jgi:hypothetical protein